MGTQQQVLRVEGKQLLNMGTGSQVFKMAAFTVTRAPEIGGGVLLTLRCACIAQFGCLSLNRGFLMVFPIMHFLHTGIPLCIYPYICIPPCTIFFPTFD